MLLLNTQFNIENAVTRRMLFEIARKWLATSSFYSLELNSELIDWNEESGEHTAETEDGSEKAFIGNYKDAFVLQFIMHDDSEAAVFTTTYVLDDTIEQHVLHFSQDKSLTGISSSPSTRQRINLPVIMKDIFWNEYGAMDACLPTEDKPFVFRKSDVDLAVGIVQNKYDFMNPVVYVSPDMHNGSYTVNCNMLAQYLMGQAHVVVEGSPIIANMIKDKVNCENAFNGNVKIYTPGGQALNLQPKADSNFNFDIINAVRNMQTRTRIDDRYDVSRLKQNYMLSKIGSDTEVYKLCESMLADKDAAINQLKNELSNAKRDLSSANCKIQNLQNSFDKVRDSADKTVHLELTENEWYAHEIRDIVLKVLQKEFDSIGNDPKVQRSRKYTVLKDILDHNEPDASHVDFVNVLKSAFKDGSLTKEGISALQAAGFNVTKGKEHYHVTFNNDDRYIGIFAVTPSDVRASKNGVSEFSNLLFGY